MRHSAAALGCLVLTLALVACGDNLKGVDAMTICEPVNDNNDCTTDVCENGVPVHTPVLAGTACATGTCNATGMCIAPSCTDGIKNGDETDIDCGGSCAPVLCDTGEGCADGGDCTSGVCSGTPMTCQANMCGDGVMQTGEMCDDGNQTNGDGCDDGTGGTCRATGCGNGTVTGTEVCDDGNAANGDGCDNNCTTSACGNGVTAGTETCDDGNAAPGDGCSATCVIESGYMCTTAVPSVCNAVCGDGLIVGAETCDQGGGNVANNDGCSSTCAVEGGYVCFGLPSTCINTCGNNALDANEQCDDGNAVDGDGCSAACQFDPGCTAGETTVIQTNATQVAIPDNLAAGVLSPVTVTGAGAVTRAVVYVGSLTHTFDADLDISLVGPSGRARAVSLDNGANGANYTRTLFDDEAATPIATGTAPFTGRFQPTSTLTVASDFLANNAAGMWNLKVVDDAGGDTGTLDSWTLMLCVDPTGSYCGDGAVNAGEECDDGNLVDTDTCTNTCGIADGCGDGNIDAGEQCDDDNLVSNDGCSATCQLELTCPGSQTPVVVAISTALPIPDNNPTGVMSPAAVTTAGAVTRIAVHVQSLTHTFDGDVDMFLVAPGGGQRELSTDNGSGGDNFVNTIFEDTAATSITLGTAPFTGTFRPEQSLATTPGVDFAGFNGAGTWNLRLVDDAGGDVGTLDRWILAMCVDPTAPYCGDGVTSPTEECDDGNTNDLDACTSQCQITDGCGDGNIDAGEQCDDNNLASGDGCSPICVLEVTCPVGQTPVLLSNNTLLTIPDGTGSISSPITVATAGAITKINVLVGGITHPFDGDLDLSLVGPSGVSRELSTDNGSAGDNYLATLFDDSAPTSVTAGTAPFTGRFRSEQSLTTTIGVDFLGANGAGDWNLLVADDTGGDTGTLDSWTITMCIDTAATYCGDGIPNGSEECDDGNLNNGDACSNLCLVNDGCGDGNIDIGEQCDDNNVTSGDGCSSLCVADIACGALETPVIVNNATVTPIPDSPGGVISTISVGTAGLVRRVIPIVNITHATNAHVDIFLQSPRGIQRDLASDLAGINYLATMFSDAAALLISAGAAPFTGTFRPEQTISNAAGFANQQAQGNWILRVGDDTAGTTGTLDSWNLALCVDTSAATVCGNGVVETGETCDDANITPSDGCSATCQLELNCALGDTEVILSATDLPLIVEDNLPAGASSTITVGAAGAVTRAVVVLGTVTHTFDADLDITLLSPIATAIDLSSGNGGGGDDFVSTIFDDTAAGSITAAVAPMRGRFQPEVALSGVHTQLAAGSWTLQVVDTAGGDTGVISSWTLGLCMQ